MWEGQTQDLSSGSTRGRKRHNTPHSIVWGSWFMATPAYQLCMREGSMEPIFKLMPQSQEEQMFQHQSRTGLKVDRGTAGISGHCCRERVCPDVGVPQHEKRRALRQAQKVWFEDLEGLKFCVESSLFSDFLQHSRSWEWDEPLLTSVMGSLEELPVTGATYFGCNHPNRTLE